MRRDNAIEQFESVFEILKRLYYAPAAVSCLREETLKLRLFNHLGLKYHTKQL